MRYGKIICSGWNYHSHNAEMKKEDLPTEPIIFLKPSSCLIGDGDEIVIPEGVTNVSYEVELALIFGKTGKNIKREDALSYVSHIAVFNDVTARDMQTKARTDGNPWSLAKGMDTFGAMSKPVKASGFDLSDLKLKMTFNGEVRQDSNTSQMIFSPAVLIEYVSKYMTIEKGDILSTGTPEGVGEMRSGDVLCASIEGVGKICNRVR